MMRSNRRVRSGVAGLVGALLAAVSLVVLAGPAEAAHAAPWRWKRVSGSASVEPGSQEDVVLYCPAGYVPVALEWSGGRKLERQAEYVDYSGNWGELKVFNHTTTGVTLSTSLNCALGADVGALTTASVTLPRSSTRSGGFVDCPSGWGPLSFGADWEG